MEANEPGFILLIVKILIAKISYPFIQAVCAAWMNAYNRKALAGIGQAGDRRTKVTLACMGECF